MLSKSENAVQFSQEKDGSQQVNDSPNRNKRVLIVGNFLSARIGTQGICETLAIKLHSIEWHVEITSTKAGRFARICDMALTTWRTRNSISVAIVDVYSGAGFIWAETVSWLLKLLGKQYILVLRGGNLPLFAQRWPGRVRRLLKRADVVVTPSQNLQSALAGFRSDIIVLRNALDLDAYFYRYRPQAQPHLAWLRALHAIYNPVIAVKVVELLVEDSQR